MLDSIISAIAPAWQAKRVRERFNLLRVQSAYDAARRTRRTKGWRTDNASANLETEEAGTLLRDRSRDMVRNNPFAAAGLDMKVAYEVGTGIRPAPRTGDAALNKQASDLWAAWGKQADVAGRLDIYGIMAQAARTRAESGEALVQVLPLTAAQAADRGLSVPLQINVLEPDLLPLDYKATKPGGNIVRQGIELDASGRPVKYWMYRQHPGDRDVFARNVTPPEPIDAKFMLHIYRQDRPGQLRGVPDLAPVMTRLRLTDEYEDAALMQAFAQATVAVFVESDAHAGKGPLEGVDDAGDPLKTMVPGMIERLLPGEKAHFMTPSGSGPFSDFTQHQLRAIATGFGLTYDLMTGDLTQANYSSLRAGRLAFKRRLEQAQWLMLIPRLCQPIWDAFIRQAVAVGALPNVAGGYPVEWGPPRFEMVDPLKDAMAVRLMMRLGLKTWSQAVSEEGWDPAQQREEMAQDKADNDAAGLMLDGDPSATDGKGAAQAAAMETATAEAAA